MTTASVTPPPPSTPTPPPPAAPRRSGPKVVAILTIVLGAAIVLGTVVTAVVGSVAATAGRVTETRSLAVAGVTELQLDAGAADVTVQFDDVDEASLRVVEGAGAWIFEVSGDTLRVATPHRPFFGWLFGDNGRAVLTLPASLEGADASLALGAGSLHADGTFGELEVDLSAGDLDVSGAASSLDLEVSAGSADVELADVADADLRLSAGDTVVRLTGAAPREVEVDVSAGGLDLFLPDVAYAVQSDVSAGRLDAGAMRTDSAASRTVTVTLSAGDVTIRPIP
ncbi:DUF4097 family beta strand repeat-containing protein [Microbacterium sp. GXF7504]